MSLGNKEIMAKNIRYYMDKKGVDRQTLVADLGLKYMTVSDWINAKTYPRIDKIELMANYFGIKKSDLVEERNNIIHTSNPTVTVIFDTVAQLHPERQKNVLSYAIDQLDEQLNEIQEPATTYEVKAVSRLAAGVGFGYDDNEIITVQVTNEPPQHDIASIVDGDSMTPNYHNGDVIYLRDKGISSYSGQVCAVVVDDKTYLKRVYTETTGLRLVSINKKYNDIVIDFPPSEDTHIKVFSVVGSDRVI